ncbi:hypothetical protein DEU56DRAFT_762361 [Suillus clintonianus]|uniref:uncharacterized protein n=1 Tax=Suillus clintonianus TaxID=1904413 RepID=UPI001B87AB5A|nr:uncharacterized protein DEU56DRAFT_762361 [Suillus clintonianus]KAG2110091.1 hypothetical protein DEU56DRAFT_762361 [Suillus clintonianus]
MTGQAPHHGSTQGYLGGVLGIGLCAGDFSSFKLRLGTLEPISESMKYIVYLLMAHIPYKTRKHERRTNIHIHDLREQDIVNSCLLIYAVSPYLTTAEMNIKDQYADPDRGLLIIMRDRCNRLWRGGASGIWDWVVILQLRVGGKRICTSLEATISKTQKKGNLLGSGRTKSAVRLMVFMYGLSWSYYSTCGVSQLVILGWMSYGWWSLKGRMVQAPWRVK